MKPHSRQLVHVGINYVMVPPVTLSRQAALIFQQAVLSEGLEFQNVETTSSQLSLIRQLPSPLQMQILIPSPQIGQFLIVAPEIETSLELFAQEAEAALNAFDKVWQPNNHQVIQVDAAIRELHETTSQHAFQELWETRLGQPRQALGAFGRPVRGGGLRFVMDPLQNEAHPAQIEVKIESFLSDTSKIFIETQFTWRKLSEPGVKTRPTEYIRQMDSYIQNHVQAFMSGERNTE
jgi:hypothetical protein